MTGVTAAASRLQCEVGPSGSAEASFLDSAIAARGAVESMLSTANGGADAERRSVLTVLHAAAELYGQVPKRSDDGLTHTAAGYLAQGLPCEPSDAATVLSRLFEASASLSGRQKLGAVYTPPDVVRFMTREALAGHLTGTLGLARPCVARVIEGEAAGVPHRQLKGLRDALLRLRILDPAVGTGAFLIGAATEVARLANTIANSGVRGVDGLRTPAGSLRHVCRGFELDSDAARAAEYILAVATANGQSRGLPEVVSVRNALLEGFNDDGQPWDIILMNPPYVGEKFLRHRLGRSTQDELRERDGFAGDLLIHFVFRGLRSLRESGVLSAIVSDTAFTMESAERMRRLLLEEAQPLSIAWCRPFRSAAVQGGIVTAQRTAQIGDDAVTCLVAAGRSSIETAEGIDAPASSFRHIPGRPIYRPTDASLRLAERWSRIPRVEDLWSAVVRRGSDRRLAQAGEALTPGSWTLLGVLVRGGQGIATGDDRRFVGFISGSLEADRALARQRRILDTLRCDHGREHQWRELKRLIGYGAPLQDGLLNLLAQRDEGSGNDLPERKPFLVVDPVDVRSGPLTALEAASGIAEGPTWIRYATGDRTTSDGGATWVSKGATVVDWSVGAVRLLRERRETGYRRPVLRNPDLWFHPAVTHNRISSYLRARLLPANCLFSSESPVYRPRGNHLDIYALLALLNSPVIDFIVKTFLATRNHVEIGHVLRVPVPVLEAATSGRLSSLGRSAAAAADQGDEGKLRTRTRELDELTRALYLIPESITLPIMR
jgi:Putative RNA methylase family UPF0020